MSAELKPLVCKCCGGTINRQTMKCEYCGTEYERQGEDAVIRIETFRNPVRTFRACVSISDNDVTKSPDLMSEVALRQLKTKLSEAIASNMVVDVVHDINYMTQKVYGTIKIVEPVESSQTLSPVLASGLSTTTIWDRRY